MRYEPLSRFPALRTQDVDELHERLSGLFSVRSIELGRGGQRTFKGHFNHRQLQDVGVFYARYGSTVAATVSHAECYVQGFPIRGSGAAAFNGAERIAISANNGVVGGPDTDVRINYSSDFEHLVLRINPQRVAKTLSALVGQTIDSVQMATNVQARPARAAAQRRLVEFVVRELDRTDNQLPELVLAELEQAMIVSYLTSNLHNYSHCFGESPVQPVAPRQVRIVEEYIEQNWDQPVTIEALALVANTGIRGLFYSFRKSRGVSPMAFVKQVRLRHAKEMLVGATPETTVTSVAYACGFNNPGHFARYYHETFGEHPSVTLRAARRLGTS